jgi:hypothetical protein
VKFAVTRRDTTQRAPSDCHEAHCRTLAAMLSTTRASRRGRANVTGRQIGAERRTLSASPHAPELYHTQRIEQRGASTLSALKITTALYL